MSQIFHPSMNAFARATIFGGVFVLAIFAWAAGVWSRSSYGTRVDVVRDQPVLFSHDHHVLGLRIDCRYCHISVNGQRLRACLRPKSAWAVIRAGQRASGTGSPQLS
jgi:hypothetical protein